MSALNEQVGGDHYKNYAIQPVEFITKNNIGFLEGCIIKRACRWRNKNGVEDLEKIIHEAKLLIELYERDDNGLHFLATSKPKKRIEVYDCEDIELTGLPDSRETGC